MSLLAATLFLSVLMLAQAHHHEDPADNLDRPPLGQHLYLFDVYSEADTENVTRCMDKLGLTVLHRFKVKVFINGIVACILIPPLQSFMA